MTPCIFFKQLYTVAIVEIDILDIHLFHVLLEALIRNHCRYNINDLHFYLTVKYYIPLTNI